MKHPFIRRLSVTAAAVVTLVLAGCSGDSDGGGGESGSSGGGGGEESTQVVNDAGEARTADIAAALHTSSTSLSQYREQLRQKSIITDVRHGVVGFTMPGFDRFVRDVTELPRLRKVDLDVLRATDLKAPALPSPATDPDRATPHSPRAITRSPAGDLEL